MTIFVFSLINLFSMIVSLSKIKKNFNEANHTGVKSIEQIDIGFNITKWRKKTLNLLSVKRSLIASLSNLLHNTNFNYFEIVYVDNDFRHPYFLSLYFSVKNKTLNIILQQMDSKDISYSILSKLTEDIIEVWKEHDLEKIDFFLTPYYEVEKEEKLLSFIKQEISGQNIGIEFHLKESIVHGLYRKTINFVI